MKSAFCYSGTLATAGTYNAESSFSDLKLDCKNSDQNVSVVVTCVTTPEQNKDFRILANEI